MMLLKEVSRDEYVLFLGAVTVISGRLPAGNALIFQ